MRTDDMWGLDWKLSPEPDWNAVNEEVLAWANIGRAFWDVSLDRIGDHLEYKRTINQYIKQMHERFVPYGVGLLLHGPLGSGKTSLACLVLRHCLAQGGRSFFVRASDLIRAEESYSTLCIRDGVPIKEMAKKVTMLAIDDLDVLDPKMKHIESIMRWRDENDLTTIVTANLEAFEAKSKSEQALSSWMRSIAAKRLIGVKIVGPKQGGYEWRQDPPE